MTGGRGQIVFGLANPVGAAELDGPAPGGSLSGAADSLPSLRSLVKMRPTIEVETAQPSLPEEDAELVFAPARRHSPQVEDRSLKLRRPGWGPQSARSATAVFECAGPVLVEPAFPQVERRRADAKVAAGAPAVTIVLFIPGHPGQPAPRFLREFDGVNTAHPVRYVQPKYLHACYNAGVRDLSERDQARQIGEGRTDRRSTVR